MHRREILELLILFLVSAPFICYLDTLYEAGGELEPLYASCSNSSINFLYPYVVHEPSEFLTYALRTP